ncbi:MAG: hypothetical protein QE277_06855 [Flectobacillus sp.]|nr:hypothetical protein [Flectobacillus sp.]
MAGKNRYPGPKPFRTDERNIFFGREKDIEEFYKYIFLHQMVVLFGKSGYGKSSLINAGIIPLLMEQNRQIHYFEIKFGPYIEGRTSPIEVIRTKIAEKTHEHSPLVLEKYLATDNSFWHLLKNYQISHEANEFIFFFDQFEELFTYPHEQILEFKQQLADVLYTSVPDFYRSQEDLLDEDAISEEFRLNFYQKPEIKIVFAIRSDRLALVEDLKDYHPAILKNCYELRGLDKEGALAAVTLPATLPDIPQGTFKNPAFEVSSALAEQLVKELIDKNNRVETSTLQIICWQVEDKFVPAIMDGDTKFVLEFSDIDVDNDGHIRGDIETVFNNYYRDTIETKVEEALRDKTFQLVEDVFVQNGQRIPFEQHYLVETLMVEQLGFPNRHVAQTTLDILREASLLKVEQDSQRRLLYELGHDTLVEPISRAAKLREEREEQKQVWIAAELAKEQAEQAQAEKEKAEQEAARVLILKRNAEVRSMWAGAAFVVAFVVAGFALYYKREADILKDAVELGLDSTKQKLDTANIRLAENVLYSNDVADSAKLDSVGEIIKQISDKDLKNKAEEQLQEARKYYQKNPEGELVIEKFTPLESVDTVGLTSESTSSEKSRKRIIANQVAKDSSSKFRQLRKFSKKILGL